MKKTNATKPKIDSKRVTLNLNDNLNLRKSKRSSELPISQHAKMKAYDLFRKVQTIAL